MHFAYSIPQSVKCQFGWILQGQQSQAAAIMNVGAHHDAPAKKSEKCKRAIRESPLRNGFKRVTPH